MCITPRSGVYMDVYICMGYPRSVGRNLRIVRKSEQSCFIGLSGVQGGASEEQSGGSTELQWRVQPGLGLHRIEIDLYDMISCNNGNSQALP